jgi:hypothetical protein
MDLLKKTLMILDFRFLIADWNEADYNHQSKIKNQKCIQFGCCIDFALTVIPSSPTTSRLRA